MFTVRKGNIDRIKDKAIKCDELLSLNWMRQAENKIIIHRGLIDSSVKEHSIVGYYKCLKNKKPMEVDLLFLNDNADDEGIGNVIVGRDYQFHIKQEDGLFSLSELSLQQIQHMNTADCLGKDGKELPFSFEETMLLKDFLNLVDGAVPLLIELKAEENQSIDIIRKRVGKLLDIMRYYEGLFAFHSSNPLVLACVKEMDRTIPCGQITWSYEGVYVSEDFKNIHQQFKFLKEDNAAYITPDFLSCRVQDLSDQEYYNKMKECKCRIEKVKGKAIPLLCWTIRNEQDENIAKRKGCTNLIAEID